LHLGLGRLENILEAAEFVRSLHLLMRGAKLVAKLTKDRLSALGEMRNDPSRVERDIEKARGSLVARDDRVPFLVRVEAKLVDQEIADLAVPAIFLNEPEHAQMQVVVPVGQRLGLHPMDALIDGLAAFLDHPSDVVVGDAKIV